LVLLLNSLTITQKQIVSIGFTFVLYWFLIGWQFALFIVVAIGFHELCHIYAAKRLGIETDGFWLVPMFGGISLIYGPYKKYKDDVIVSLGGPIGGGILAITIAIVYYLTGISLLGTIAFWMMILNLANCAPLGIVDGGHVMNAITYSVSRKLGFYMQIASTVIMIFVIGYFNPVLMILLAILGAIPIHKEYRDQKFYEKTLIKPVYPSSMTKKQMIFTGIVWLSTVVVLGTLAYSLRGSSSL
jgi:putative peptide zinc metalloprotease protein